MVDQGPIDHALQSGMLPSASHEKCRRPDDRLARLPFVARSAVIAVLILLSLVTVPMAHEVDLDTIATAMIFVFAAGVGWFLWRHK